jgi:hypothetical protein
MNRLRKLLGQNCRLGIVKPIVKGGAATGVMIMRRLPFILFVVCVAVVLANPVSAGDKQTRTNYYPLKEGTKWHYRVELPGLGMETFIVHVAKIEKIDGVALARLETSKQGQVLATEHLTSNDRGVYRHRFNGQVAGKPVCLIKYPVTPGEKWEDETEFGGQKVKMAIRVGKEEEVSVPAGKFKTIPVHIEAEVMGMTVTTTYWFAANVGYIKQVADLAGQKMTMELEKLEEAK